MAFPLRTELRHASRRLLRAPVLSGAAVFNLALGIGATAAIFTAVSTALLRPLPFPQPDRLVSVFRTTPHFTTGPFSAGTYLDLRRETGSLEGLAAVARGSMLLQSGDRSVPVAVARVSDDFFSLLGAEPAEGRLFAPGEAAPDQPMVAVVAEELWRERLGADPGVLGISVRLDGIEMQIVGVLPGGFRVPHGGQVLAPDVWIPLRFDPAETTARRNNHLLLLGRLRPGVDLEAADAELVARMAGIVEAHPELRGEQLRVASLQSESVRTIRGPLTLLLGAVALVLLIAVTNTASLLLARGSSRQGEWSTRAALGAGRADVHRAALIESALLTAAGALLGVALAWIGVRAIGSLVPAGLPQLSELAIDRGVLAFALGLSLLVALGCGFVPAWQAQRADPQQVLRAEGRSGGDRHQHRLLRGLVVAEVSLSLVLLLGAGLLLRGFERLVNQEPGFDPAPLLTLEVNLPPDRYPDGTAFERFLQPALEALRSRPGVEAAAAVSVIPYDNWGWNFNIRYEGQPGEDPTRLPLTETRVVTPSYFDTMGLSLLRGRLFSPVDEAEESPSVVVVNRALAERDFPGEDPVGKRFHRSDTELATIIGVVSDLKNSGPDRPPHPGVYWSWTKVAAGATSFPLVVRVNGEPADFAPAVASVISSIDPAAAVSRVRPMAEVIASSMGRPRFYLVLLAVFAGVAMALALAGIYGVMSYSVERRRRELGIRSVLGSTPGSLVSLVTGQGLVLVAAGVVLGLLGSWGVTRFLTGMLYGVSPLDPTTWAAVTLLLVLTNVLAILVPAGRAAAVDPLVAIRSERA
jgi:putative ABC transport system permease protein